MGTEELVRSLESVVFLSWKRGAFEIRTVGELLLRHTFADWGGDSLFLSRSYPVDTEEEKGLLVINGRDGSRGNL
jgi:hypothetical protein